MYSPQKRYADLLLREREGRRRQGREPLGRCNRLLNERVRGYECIDQSTLQRLREIKKELNPNLGVLGVVVNRTLSAQLNGVERPIVESDTAAWHGHWGQAVPLFTQCVPDRISVRDAEDDLPPKAADPKFINCLRELAEEIVGAMSPHCGPSLEEWSPSPAPSVAGGVA